MLYRVTKTSTCYSMALLKLFIMGFFFLLNQVSNEYYIDIWHQGWITIVSLGLIGEQINDRNACLDHIKKDHIKLKEEPDSLALSKNKIRGEFTAKSG